ncbi:hypothetical protein [Arsenicibacter rosenii]|nr:hypothetical protein [Arsenicibacter rosenii]
MEKRKKSILLRQIFCLLMALHVINVSIDAPDYNTPNGTMGVLREDLSVNEIESLGELVLEEWLGFTDAFPEHDDAEDDYDVTQLEQDFFFYPVVGVVFCPTIRQLPTHRFVQLPPPRVLTRARDIIPMPPRPFCLNA